MNKYNIQIVSRITGLGIHTLRAWEKRYQVVIPERSKRGQRLYSEKEVEKLQLLSQLCLMGRSISTMTNMTNEELKNELKLCGIDIEFNKEKFFPADKVDSNLSLSYLILSLKHYKLDVLNHEIQILKISLTPREFAFDILAPLLNEVGNQVASGKLSIAQEHALSSIIKFHVGHALYQNYEKKIKNQNLIILATPENEYHEFGIMISALICASINMKFYYLGASLPAEALVQAANSIGSNLIILGTTKNTVIGKEKSIDKYLNYCFENLNKNCNIWVGGGADFNLHQWQKNKKFKFISSLPFLETCLKEL